MNNIYDITNNFPKYIKYRNKLYLYHKLFIILNNLLDIKLQNKEFNLYLLFKTNLKINFEEINADSKNYIFINDIIQLNNFIYKQIKINNKVLYKINLYSEQFLNIENNEQFYSYKNKIIYAKIIKENFKKLNFNNNSDIFTNNKIKDKFFLLSNRSYSQINLLNSKLLTSRINYHNTIKKLIKDRNLTFVNNNNDVNLNNLSNNEQNKYKESNNFLYNFCNNKNYSIFKNLNLSPKNQTKLKKNYSNLDIIKNIKYNQDNSNLDNIYIPNKLFPLRKKLHKPKTINSNINSKFKIISTQNIQRLNNINKKIFNNNINIKKNLNKNYIEIRDFLLNESKFEYNFKIKENNSKPNENENIKLDIDTNIEIIQKEYFKILINIKDVIINILDNIIDNKFIDYFPKKLILNNNIKYIKKFPFNQCLKQFIFYCYLSYFSLKTYNNFFLNINFDYSILQKYILDLKLELKIIKNNYKNINIFFEKYYDKIFINKKFFNIFVLCTNYFNDFQKNLSNKIMILFNLEEKIYFNKYYEYYLYFNCSDLLNNNDKFNFLKKLFYFLNLNDLKNDEGKYYKQNLKNLFNNNEFINLMINENLFDRSCFKNENLINKYHSIDSIYIALINFFRFRNN